MSIIKIDNIEKEQIKAAKNTYKQVLIGPDQGPNFAMRRFIIGPGGEMPFHTNSVEHEQFVLNGSALVKIGDENFTVQKNDVVFIPANVPHSYKTLGDEAFEFLCVIPNKEDVLKIVT
ncbi:cupin domain-containing protein [candidate division KSB1 bacterium]|nr:cupin domain-containing protein [candidate division KSB1 bacterium]